MSSLLQHGQTGTPLPSEEVVIRLIKASKDGKVLETHFTLSTADENSPLKSISVWAERLTSAVQACEFMGSNKLVYELYCRLSVARVRTLTTVELERPVLDVIWDTLYDEVSGNRDMRPGASGHSGIIGLKRPPDMPKDVYRKLRVKLTDIANESCYLVDDGHGQKPASS